MAAKLTDKPLLREVNITGIGTVILEIHSGGISMRGKGGRKRVFTPWLKVVKAAYTPTDVPSFLHGKPVELLKHQLK